jgi:hypothetical protein
MRGEARRGEANIASVKGTVAGFSASVNSVQAY